MTNTRSGLVGAWQEVDLRIVEHDRGLLVRQGEDEYLALNWRLTPELHRAIDEAIANGLVTVIRTNHPKPNNRRNGVKYIAFSRTPYERWVITFDQYSPSNGTGDGEIRQFTVEQSYRSVLEAAEIPYRQERGGGKNLYVPFEHVSAVLAATNERIDDVENALGARDWNRVKDEIGFITEAVLESAILANWKSIPAFADLELIGNQIDHMDILARHRPTGALVVFELKRSLAGLEVLDQLRGYLQGAAQLHGSGQEVWGAILAREFTTELVGTIDREPHPISLFRFRGTPGSIALEAVVSSLPSIT